MTAAAQAAAPEHSTHTPLQGALTFKREPRTTGLARIGDPNANVQIKVGGRQVGTIFGPDWRTEDGMWSATLMVHTTPTAAKPCPWKSVRLVKRTKTEGEMREWLQQVQSALKLKYNLYQMAKD